MKHHSVVFMAVVAALTLVSCKHAPPAGVAAQVNSHSITYADLDKYYQTQQQQAPEGSSEDLVMSQKLELLNSLITNEIMLQRAEKMGLSAVDADVDTELNKMKAPYTKEDFEKQLADRHMTVDDLRAQLRRELTVNKLINKEITSHINITDADVKAFYETNKASFNLPEPQVHMAQILVTPFPDPNVRNLKNSKAQNETEAKTKIYDLAGRLQRGEDFGMLAQNYSEDPATAPNGGDMGFIPASNLEKAEPDLKRLIDSLQPGTVSPPIHTQDGYRILKVISREPAGQRDLKRSARAAEHPGNPAQPEGPVTPRRLLRSGPQQREDRELPGAQHRRECGEIQVRPGLPRLAHLVDVDGVFHGAALGMHHGLRLPAFDGKLVRNHARAGLQVLLQVGLQALVGTGEEVHRHHGRRAQVHPEHAVFHRSDMVFQAERTDPLPVPCGTGPAGSPRPRPCAPNFCAAVITMRPSPLPRS